MPITLEMPDGPPVELDYAEMVTNVDALNASAGDPQKIFWMGKINDYLATTGNKETTYFLSEIFRLTASLRQGAPLQETGESLATIRNVYIDPKSAFLNKS
jgi:hypothetical protein